ncbi:MAG: hypothetical protein ACYTKD_20440 [Planctomycetota bacterium]|jgi:hypothetical protein
MCRVPPSVVVLTAEEESLLARIDFNPDQFALGGNSHDVMSESCAAAKTLTLSLLERDAIPAIRKEYLANPKYNIGKKKMSRLEVFESNGTCGDAIFEHPHWLKYLRYIIYGPDLPKEAISGFRRIVSEDAGTSGMVLDSLCKYVRSETRKRDLGRRRAADEFHKLALECGVDDHTARCVRDAARQVR